MDLFENFLNSMLKLWKEHKELKEKVSKLEAQVSELKMSDTLHHAKYGSNQVYGGIAQIQNLIQK